MLASSMMVVLKVAPIFLVLLAVRADKKIELQDIEDDNLKSEKENEYDKTDQRSQISSPSSGPGLPSLDFLKNGFLRYFESPPQPSQQSRYVQQYAVTEQPERPPVISSKAHYGPPQPVHQQQQYQLPQQQYQQPQQQYQQPQQQYQQTQQAMVGYLSNVPMQIYLVPQYYSDASEQGHATTAAQYTTSAGGRVSGYPTAPEAVQTQSNYIEVPNYVAPTQKTYIPQYSQPVTYVSIAAPTAAPAPTIAPVVAYQLPVVQYNAGAVISPNAQKPYYPGHYTETNTVEETQEGIDENPKHYTHTEVSYAKSPANEYRYYSNRPPPRDEYRHNHISELPHPNSLLLKPSPPHLSHIPKALPMYRPLNKPVYGTSPTHPPVPFPRPSEAYGVPPYKRRPSSLLDSYVPSSLQIEYMKRGYTNDPIAAYEALSSGRHFSHAPAPRHFERGFLPNQMYHTAAGGVTFGHYKRTPKIDKVSQK